MRVLLKVSLPTEIANDKARDGTLGSTIRSILEEQEPEAVYFTEFDGERTGIIVVNIDEASEIPAIAEPWFQAFEAGVEIHPAMVPADLDAAGEDIETAAGAYG